ncbi:hypothetical protein D3C77_489620 [compost metagenome]
MAPSFKAARPAAATAIAPVMPGNVSAAQLSPSTITPSGPRTAFSAGNIALPINVVSRVSLAVKAFQPVREVFATPAASCIIEPCSPIADVAYLVLSLTISNARCTSPRFCRSGWIAPIDSDPNNWVATAACSSTGWSRIASRTFMIVAGASACMSLARSSGSNPSFDQTSFCPLVAASPFVRAAVKFLKPVPAISFSVPGLRNAADSAADCSGVRPDALPTAP